MTRSRSIAKPLATDIQVLAVINFLMASYATPNELPPEIRALVGLSMHDTLSFGRSINMFQNQRWFSFVRGNGLLRPAVTTEERADMYQKWMHYLKRRDAPVAGHNLSWHAEGDDHPGELQKFLDSLNVGFSGQQIKDMLSENPNVDGFVHSLPYSYGRAAQYYNLPYYDASEELREHFGLPSGI